MNEKQYGVIPLDDYIKIVDRRKGRTRRVRKWGLGAAALTMCMLCTAAGDYLGPWSGKRARDLSFEQALSVMASDVKVHRLRAASEKMRRYCKRSIQALADLRTRRPAMEPTVDAILLDIWEQSQKVR